jgi:hypothetical protein
MSDAEQIAAFIASKGVTRVGEGETNGMRNRDWRKAVRGGPTEGDLINQRRVVIDHTGREFVQNGLGEWIA